MTQKAALLERVNPNKVVPRFINFLKNRELKVSTEFSKIKVGKFTARGLFVY